MSQTTASLLGDRFDTIDLGRHRLRDLGEPMHVLQLIAEGLQSDYPPLRSLNSSRGNLPEQLTSFVGRSYEVAHLLELMDAHQLVTLIGVGGTGKTRLAVQTAAEAESNFGDGAWLVELASVGDESGAIQQFMKALGIRSATGVPNRQRLAEALEAREMLLIVDNCEHLLGVAASLVDDILNRAPTVRIVATSREPLLVSGEQIMGVPSLDASDVDGDTNAAVLLFLDRCSTEGREIDPAGDDAANVNEICQRLDGIPLAIELAAARARTMGVGDIRDRLSERFRLLKGGRRTATERHQTLRATVEWSYRLLNDRERDVFDRLSVRWILLP